MHKPEAGTKKVGELFPLNLTSAPAVWHLRGKWKSGLLWTSMGAETRGSKGFLATVRLDKCPADDSRK